ncbi:MAG: CPBP family intramembrane metalloprotease, partial [Chloroflexi bacterium]|nr:CPBP family intramembrane metalloprotease [Chloroflexota bacterium]
LTAAVVSGLVWAVWHYPLIFFAPEVFDFGTLPLYFAVPMFTLVLIAVSVVLGWLRLTTGSVWPAVIVHGSHNSFTLSFFNDLTSESGAAPYIAGEVGIGLLVMWVIAALACWRLYSKSPIVSEQPATA